MSDITPITPKAKPFDFLDEKEDAIQLAQELARVVVEKNGIAVAAPQIGINYRVLALKSNPIIVAFNPIMVEVSEDTETLEEGTLSLPGFAIKVKRPDAIKVRFTEANGNVRTEFFMGLTARYFQQAMDYLDGITPTQRAHPVHKDQANKEKKQNERKDR